MAHTAINMWARIKIGHIPNIYPDISLEGKFAVHSYFYRNTNVYIAIKSSTLEWCGSEASSHLLYEEFGSEDITCLMQSLNLSIKSDKFYSTIFIYLLQNYLLINIFLIK